MVQTNPKTDQPTTDQPKADLLRYLQAARDALLWKLDGLSEYDVRRPLTPTGTNLLGLVKHLAGVEAGYFGEVFGRPFFAEGQVPSWYGDDAEPNADMWATADESREDIIGLYHQVWEHAHSTIAALPLDATGHVPWWREDQREVTLHRILVHVIAETGRHAGHADIVRELIDGAVGMRKGNENMPSDEGTSWDTYRRVLEDVARSAG
ncbi:DinB family protein [Streptomyces sp. NPDC050433]|uniref:DinB family protein n=1 Tax=unclassified Streptomyces TaxID=2593676 RepID=UPI0034307F45